MGGIPEKRVSVSWRRQYKHLHVSVVGNGKVIRSANVRFAMVLFDLRVCFVQDHLQFD
jgi:hypothetical protein